MTSLRIRTLVLLCSLVASAAASAATIVVRSGADAGGDGSAERPLATLRAAEEASGPGDTILLVRGSKFEERITLESGQILAASSEPANQPPPLLRASEQAAITARDLAGITIRDVALELTGSANGIALQRVTGNVAITNVTIAGKTTGDAIAMEDVTASSVISGTTIRDVLKRGVFVVKSTGLTLRDVRFVNAPSTNGVAAAKCGTPSAAGDHFGCGAAIHLQSAATITLDRVIVEDAAQIAINGEDIRDLTMTAVEVRGAGDETNEHGVQLHNVSGTLRISGSRFEANEARQLYIVQETGEAAIDIRETTFTGAKPPNNQQGFLLQSRGDARVRVVIDKATFVDNFSNAVQLIAEGTSELGVEVMGSTFRKNAAAITATAGDAATFRYRIAKNKIEQSTSSAINIHATTKNAASGEITENTVSHVACGGGCSGISVTAIGRGTSSAIVDRNTIDETDASGILARAGGDATLNIRIAGNSIRKPLGNDALHAIAVLAGIRKGDRAMVCAEIGGEGAAVNTISGPWNAAGEGAIGLIRRADLLGSFTVARYAGDRTNAATLAKFIAGRNRGAGVEAQIPGGITLSDGCTIR